MEIRGEEECRDGRVIEEIDLNRIVVFARIMIALLPDVRRRAITPIQRVAGGKKGPGKGYAGVPDSGKGDREGRLLECNGLDSLRRPERRRKSRGRGGKSNPKKSTGTR